MASVEPRRGSGSATEQGRLWGARPRDWAEVQETTGRELYLAVLAALDLRPGTAVLDVGCGSGLFASLAAAQGALVCGIDAAPELVAIARDRVPEGRFEVADMEALPVADASADVVCLLNSLHYAARPAVALREAARAARPGATIVIGAWDTGEGSAPAAYIRALARFVPEGPGPLSLTAPGAVEALLAEAGLRAGAWQVVECPFIYRDREEALRGLLSSGPAAGAVAAAGEARVRDAVAETIAPFANAFGAYRMDNRYRFILAHADRKDPA